jgi:chromosome segregation ATPase
MATEELERAAGEALARLTSLGTRVHDAEARLAATREQVERAGAQLEDDWQMLTRQFEAFLRAVDEAETGLGSDGGEAERALSAAAGAIAGAQETAPQVEAAAEEIGAWGGRVEARGLAAAERADDARRACERLTQRAAAVEQQLGEALGDARDFLHGEVLTDLERIEQQVRQRRTTLHAAVGECEGDLDTAFEGWRHGLGEVRVTVDRAFDDVARHALRTVKEALAGLAPAQQAALEDLSRRAEALAQALAQLADAATDRGVELGDGVGALEEEAGTAASALEVMQDRLSEVRELLSRFSFVSF